MALNQNQSLSERKKERQDKLKKIYQQKNNPARKEKIRQAVPEDIIEKNNDNPPEDFLYFWRAKEYEKKIRSQKWFIIVYLILMGLIVYSFLTNNLLMSVLFILIGVVFYLFEKKEPEEYTFGITYEGVFAEDRIYEFSSLKNFWIFYQPEGLKELSLESKKKFMPFVEIPLGNADPIRIRKTLIKFLPEKEHHKPLLNILMKYLD